MKKYTSILPIMLISIFLMGQDIDPINGFRGIDWGTQKSNVVLEDGSKPVLNLHKTIGNSKIYTIPSDDRTIGAAVIDEIYYYFHDEAGMYKVTFSGNENSKDEMDAVLKNRLGPADTELFNTTNVHRIWRVNDIIVDYKEQSSKDYIVVIKSNEIAEYNSKANQKINDF